nr:EOG090X0439 [Chydorus sphaericus]
MASDLPDALEKLALKQEQSESEASQSSLSKYFGQVDNGDDIFDTIAKPTRPDSLEPKVNFFKSPASTPVKEEASRTNSIGKATPSFAFKKCEDDEEPKVFSYFNQPEEAGKDSEATEFFDQISELTSKTHKPLEISSHPVVEQQVNSEAPLRPAFESSLQVEIPSQQLPGKAPSPLPIFTPHVTSPPALASTMDLPSEIIWSKTQERASGWWIPKDKTRRWLQQSSGSTVIPSSELTSPSISNSAEFVDPIKQLLRHYDGETAAAGRQTLTADLVTQDDRGIKDLIKVGCWRAAANLCGRLLTSYGQGYGKVGQPTKHTHHTLQLWFTRLAMLVKSQLSEVAFNEALQFGDLDAPDLYFDYYAESGQRGTMVPFNFRLLVAELPAHQNQINRAQSRLCQVLATVRRIVSDVDRFASVDGMNSPEERREVVELWTRRETQTIFALVNCALRKKVLI